MQQKNYMNSKLKSNRKLKKKEFLNIFITFNVYRIE